MSGFDVLAGIEPAPRKRGQPRDELAARRGRRPSGNENAVVSRRPRATSRPVRRRPRNWRTRRTRQPKRPGQPPTSDDGGRRRRRRARRVRAALVRRQGGEHLLGVPVGLHVVHHLGDVALGVDHERRALHAPVLLAAESSRPRRRSAPPPRAPGSARSVNGSEYFSRNFTCEASSSGLMPRTTRRASRTRSRRRGTRRPRPCSRACRPWDRVEDDRLPAEVGEPTCSPESDVSVKSGAGLPSSTKGASVRRAVGVLQDGSHPSRYAARSSGPKRAWASSGFDVSSGRSHRASPPHRHGVYDLEADRSTARRGRSTPSSAPVTARA